MKIDPFVTRYTKKSNNNHNNKKPYYTSKCVYEENTEVKKNFLPRRKYRNIPL